ncbi:MAG: hypothetical protein IIA83_01050 [Thaumarchaeota archaeon]|nr:hypothetical protein [Nitrososphaerota archaeon]
MDVEKLPKKELGRIYESNLGRTENEWGNRKDRSKKCIIAYDLKWNIDEENVTRLRCVPCGHSFKFFGSSFCSKKCYEDYFVPKLT